VSRHRVFVLPNALTLARVPLAVAVWIRPGDDLVFFTLLLVAGVSDVLDGWLARRLDPSLRTDPDNPGAWLDPLCDKIFVVSAVVATLVAESPPAVWVLLLLARDLLQAPLIVAWALLWRPRGRRVDFRAVPAGKATTVLQFLGLVAVRLRPEVLPIVAATAAVTGVLSVVLVVRRVRASSA
jgi:cardiolipin synthase